MTDRDALLAASDAELLAQCEVDVFRGSGAGGQKRNKTSNAVRIRHTPTGLAGTCTESRSQHENRARALRRLRDAIALDLRQPVDDGWAPPPALAALVAAAGQHRSARRRQELDYLQAAAALLDVFVACGCAVSDTGARLGLTTGATSRLLTEDERVARKANELRAARDLKPLR